MCDDEQLIRDARAADESGWRSLWRRYLRFYDTDLPDLVTTRTWARILDPAAPVFAIVAERGGALAGFAICVLHEATWSLTPVCYLEDLFVTPAARGNDTGHALISELLARAAAKGWSKLYWHTKAGNEPARRLYDRFAVADDFVRYRLTPP